MPYQFLGQDLHDTADKAKACFRDHYGAKGFKCEEQVDKDLQLRPTWQASQGDGYILAINVQPNPFSPTLHEFVNKGAQKGLPLKLWVAVPRGPSNTTFNQDLRSAHQVGAGVIDFSEDGDFHVFHRPVPLSLFALNKIDPKSIPAKFRASIRAGEDTFSDGDPGQGCQTICQELEDLTRRVVLTLHVRGCFLKGWTPRAGAAFFETGNWGPMLEACEDHIDFNSARAICPGFNRDLIVRARGFRDWRNSVSHKPKTLKDLMKRDARLRTMFEATRDLLIDWANSAKPLRI